ncbi:MAG: TIGR01777 family oxidoreductase [Deltaproteobacteria bacterium]|nr:TIGR01777 family oxidoreductase [Deltaproteobacteria bacterium]
MKIFMTGGTGFVGTTLTQRLTHKGHQVSVLTRSIPEKRPLPQGASYVEGDPTKQGPWQKNVSDHDIIINLAGASIFKRWTDSVKTDILESRIRTTNHLVAALTGREGRETLFLSTSAVGYYGFHGAEALDEETPSGEGFLAEVSREWESAALKAEESGAKVTLFRSGVVLGRHGGALKLMARFFKWFLGSPLGKGEQYFSWIHEEDLARIYEYVIERNGVSGPINCTAPAPVRNKDMTTALAKALGKPVFMPAIPSFLAKIVMGEFASLFLEGQNVLPKKLLDMGFRFRFTDIGEAFQDLLGSVHP